MTKNQRLFVLILLAGVLVTLIATPFTRANVRPEIGAILYGSLFLLSFTALLLEHFFGRPTDVLAASVSILLLIVPSQNLLADWGIWYSVLVGYEAVALIAATIALLLLSDQSGPLSWRNRISAVLKSATTTLASGRAQYFWLFFFTLIHFVEAKSIPFISLAAYAALILFFDPSRLALVLPATLSGKSAEVGEILGVQGRNDFLVRLYPSRGRPALRVGDPLEFVYGMDESGKARRGLALERFLLDQAQWVRVHCHPEIDRELEAVSGIPSPRTDAVYRLSSSTASEYLKNLIGSVEDGSDVRTLRFVQSGNLWVEVGDLVQLEVGEHSVIYQVVNARVDTEALERKNEADFVVGEAVQLGHWQSESGQFEPFGWVPAARTPVFKAVDVEAPELEESEIDLGAIPGSSFPVVLHKAAALSHHTAVLGVTGVGKSVFARELVRRYLDDDDVRVIVVDFTREWEPALKSLGGRGMFDAELQTRLHSAIRFLLDEKEKWPRDQDKKAIAEQKKVLFDGFKNAIEDFLKGDEGLRVFELPDVVNTEGGLEYTQWFFKTLLWVARDSKCHGKRVCVVLEEAHTVIPEWNFLGVADKSSQSLVNSIGQIALQGRKYGVGFLVIAQRTASVSKTVLTQCNTIIAFQCFDRTSIEFLAHYLPREIVETLPTLRSRRAVAVGKSIRGSVPLIFDVPEIEEIL